jgi:hypothetical protein
MTDAEFLTECVARCEAGGGSAAFSDAEIARLVKLSGVDGIDYVDNGTGSRVLSARLVGWLAELAGVPSP